jgi:uncharacterized protein (TIGR03000 family)
MTRSRRWHGAALVLGAVALLSTAAAGRAWAHGGGGGHGGGAGHAGGGAYRGGYAGGGYYHGGYYHRGYYPGYGYWGYPFIGFDFWWGYPAGPFIDYTYAPCYYLYTPDYGPPPAPVYGSADPGTRAYPHDTAMQARPPVLEKQARVLIRVPADAQLWVEETQTNQTGAQREFVSPELAPGKAFVYAVRARWQADGKTVDQTRQVEVKASSVVMVDFTNRWHPKAR